MDSLCESVVAGAAAAIAATIILGFAKYVYEMVARSRDEKYIRSVLMKGKERVLSATDAYNNSMGATLPEEVLRAAQYNNMIKELDIALEKWAPHLTHDQRKGIFDALDWYHTDNLQFTLRGKVPTEVDLPPGKWPTTQMPLDRAQEKFEKLQSIEWLNL